MSESMGGIISECPGDFIGIGNRREGASMNGTIGCWFDGLGYVQTKHGLVAISSDDLPAPMRPDAVTKIGMEILFKVAATDEGPHASNVSVQFDCRR